MHVLMMVWRRRRESFAQTQHWRTVRYGVGAMVACVAWFSIQLAAGSRLPPLPPSTRPNIVVIMADDLDLGLLSRMEEMGLLPNIKAHLIDKGTRFTNAFVTNSLCCPSRATLLTGQYSHNHGVRTNAPEGGILQLDDTSTLATWLQAAGYRTSYIGKYLNRYGLADLTRDGVVDQADQLYTPPGWNDWEVLVDPSTYNVYDYKLNDNGRIVQYGRAAEDYQTDVLASRAASFIRRSAAPEQELPPFFLTVMPLAPHIEVFAWSFLQEPWQWDIRPASRHLGPYSFLLPRPPSLNEANVSDKPSWIQDFRPSMTAVDIAGLNRQYRHRLEAMRAVDDLVGRVVAALQETGALENTAIFFTSDNGFLHGEHRMPQKMVAYEEAIRVPLLARIPGALRAVVDETVINNDLAPTIAEMGGAVPTRQIDGMSFRSLLDRAGTPWRRRFLIEHWAANDDPQWDVPRYTAVRSREPLYDRGNVLFVQYEDPAYTPEFYDMRNDPYQLSSLHDASSAFRVQQLGLLKSWTTDLKRCQGQSCRDLEFRP